MVRRSSINIRGYRTKRDVKFTNFRMGIKSSTIEKKEGESWDLVEFERRVYLIVNLIFFICCKNGSCDSVIYGPSLNNLFMPSI